MQRSHSDPRDARHPYALSELSLAGLVAMAAFTLLPVAGLAAPLLTLSAFAGTAAGAAVVAAVRRVPFDALTVRLRPLRLRVTVARPAEE